MGEQGKMECGSWVGALRCWNVGLEPLPLYTPLQGPPRPVIPFVGPGSQALGATSGEAADDFDAII